MRAFSQGWLQNVLIYLQTKQPGLHPPLLPPSQFFSTSALFSGLRGEVSESLVTQFVEGPRVEDSSDQDAQPQPPATHRLGYEKPRAEGMWVHAEGQGFCLQV